MATPGTLNIDPNIPRGAAWLGQDFTPKEKAYGVGGWNQFFVDPTTVSNLPLHPQDKAPMAVKWIYPRDLEKYRALGWHPVPEECFRPEFNGGKPVTVHSPSCKMKNGLMERDNMVVLVWTRPKTYEEQMRWKAEKAWRAKYGETRALGDSGDSVPADGKFHSIGNGIAEMTEISVETETAFASGIKNTKASGIRPNIS